MPHHAAPARASRSALRRFTCALALLFLSANAAHAGPIFSVGSREVIYTATQRKNLGLNFWPDGNMGVAAAGDGRIQFYAANSTSSVRTTGTLTAPAQSKQSVSIVGASGFNYLAGGPVYQDAASSARLMVYHAEVHGGSSQDYYTTLGLAVARDSSGLVFDNLGLIIQPNIAGTQTHSIDIGGGSLNLFNGDLYVHYRDYMADGSSAELAVAKAPLATVISNAINRQATEFTKYYNGGWTQPGLGGLASPLETGNPYNAWSSASYNDYLNQFVMVAAQPGLNEGGNLYMSTSTDGVAWGPRQAIAMDPGEQFYPSLIGTGADPARTGKSFYVYYTDSAAGAWNRWNDAQLVRREITFDPAPPPPPATPEWASVGSFAGDFQTGAPAAGWQYLWAAKGKAGTALTYAPLKWSDVAGAYNTTGAATPTWSNGKSHVDDYLSLAGWGGHPGKPGYNVMASYTIQADDGAGLYRIANSSITKADSIASSGEDGLSLAVYVNNTIIGKSQSVSTSGAPLNFDRELGQLAIGDTVYVMIGAKANQNHDLFTNFDFTIQRSLAGTIVSPPPVVPPVVPPVIPPLVAPEIPPVVTPPPAPTMAWMGISDLQNDFQTGTPALGWRYLWAATAKTGNASTYAPLKWSDMAGAYNTTGAATQAWTGGNGHVDDYLSLAGWGGHPGKPGYNVIASYTIQADDGAGLYRLVNSLVSKIDGVVSKGEDGLTLMVYVNNTLIGKSQTVSTNGAALTFDRELGQLNIGDAIYVVLGAGTNQNYDLFKGFDFTVEKLSPVAEMFAAAMAIPEPASAAQLTAVLAFALVRRRNRTMRDLENASVPLPLMGRG